MSDPDPSLSRQALHLSTMLPQRRGEAIKVIALLIEIVQRYWPDVCSESDGHRPGATVIDFPGQATTERKRS